MKNSLKLIALSLGALALSSCYNRFTGNYDEFPYDMPEGHTTDDIVKILRKEWTHDNDLRTNFDNVIVVFSNGDVYYLDWYNKSVRGAELTRLNMLCDVSDHIVELFYNVDNVLCVLMDDNMIYCVENW